MATSPPDLSSRPIHCVVERDMKSSPHAIFLASGFPNTESMKRLDKAWVEVLAQQDKVLSGGVQKFVQTFFSYK